MRQKEIPDWAIALSVSLFVGFLVITGFVLEHYFFG